MKSSEILREAARRVETGENEYGCHAIQVATYGSFLAAPCAEPEWDSKIMKRYRVVSPDGARDGDAWWDTYDDCGDYNNGPRIIGLCLAAAIAEDDGD